MSWLKKARLQPQVQANTHLKSQLRVPKPQASHGFTGSKQRNAKGKQQKLSAIQFISEKAQRKVRWEFIVSQLPAVHTHHFSPRFSPMPAQGLTQVLAVKAFEKYHQTETLCTRTHSPKASGRPVPSMGPQRQDLQPVSLATKSSQLWARDTKPFHQ